MSTTIGKFSASARVADRRADREGGASSKAGRPASLPASGSVAMSSADVHVVPLSTSPHALTDGLPPGQARNASSSLNRHVALGRPVRRHRPRRTARSSPSVCSRNSSSRQRLDRLHPSRMAGVARASSTTMSASVPGVQRADLVRHRQRLGIAARQLPEGLERVELLAVQRDHLVALVHGAQHRIVGAAADIGGRGDPERLCRARRKRW